MVVRTAAERFPAKVEVITPTKEGDYGSYKSVLFLRSDLSGDEAKVWRAMKPSEAEKFTRGQQVYLVPTINKKNKPSWDIELLSDAAAAPATSDKPRKVIDAPAAAPAPVSATPPQTTEVLSKEQKQAIAAYVSGQADLLAYCWQQAEAKLPGKSEESCRCAATTLYIAAQRKFSL